MRFRFCFLLATVLGASPLSVAQEAARPHLTDATALQAPSTVPGPVPPKKEIYWKGWKQFVPNLVRHQKRIWLFPVSVAKGQHLKPTLAVAGITAGLVALDPSSGRYFQRTQSFNGFNRAFSGPNTTLGMGLFPVAFYALSLARKDTYAQKTFLLAGEAVLTSEILTSVMKDATRRLNPGVVPPNGDFSDTWFKKEQGSWVRGIGSFPSGHTIAAFSIATVFAERYPNPRWHRWLAYGLASLVGFSRVSLESHFPSDVFLGAALGHVIARDIVRRAP
jgi:undecaprenyl-diphosphatase